MKEESADSGRIFETIADDKARNDKEKLHPQIAITKYREWYTGIGVWVDPTYNLVYIFLSNRVNPKVTDKLSSLNIRPRIQDAVYQAIQKGLQ